MVMSVNSKMTAIADAIREKTGESGTLTLDAMAAAIAAIEAGGGGKILGHVFAEGSFTLAEDTTSEYTVITANELFEAIKGDFPDATSLISNVYVKGTSEYASLHYFLAAICWKDNTDAFDTDYAAKEFLGAFLSKPSINNASTAAAYADSYGNYTAKSVAMLRVSSSGFSVKFSSSQAGYAGGKYNWVVFPIDHGEVQL